MIFDFEGKSVLVTGGTSGIGRAVAEMFAHSGARVIAAGLPGNKQDTEGIRTELLDVADLDAIQGLVSIIPELHVLVNAAGIIRRDSEFDLEIFEQVLDTNLTGTMRTCMAARGHLAKTRGCIVNIASLLSFFGGPRVPAYSASKGGVAQLTKSLALAWAADGIRVNAVAPGWVTTPLTKALQDDATRAAPVLARTPLARWGRPEEIAGPVLFLCSDAASFMTGSIVSVDGGYSAG
jgi:NAD(P)-dependent dehydrogenase (short-subunit alcohol dehydrogenase family)